MRHLKLTILLLALVIGAHKARAEHNPLLPRPQSIQYGTGRLLVNGLVIRFGFTPSAEDRFGARQLSRALKELTGVEVPVCEGSRGSPAVVLTRTDPVDHPLPMLGERPGPDSREAYHLRVTPTGAEIRGRSSAGVFCGVQTLSQLVEGKGEEALLPEVEIDDWPSLAYRQTMWDMSEGFRSTEEEVKRQLDFMARWKANQYGFYSENSIELDGYGPPDAAMRFTKDQVRRIIAYGRERHIDVIPFLELYGHQHDLLRREKYSDLADCPHGWEFDPNNPEVKTLLGDWAEQFTQLFLSPFVHVGFDETEQIAQAAKEEGAGATPVKLFIGQLNFVANLFQRWGKRVMINGDMLGKIPGIAGQLPPNIIVTVWYYDPSPDPEYKQWLQPIVKNGIPFLVMTEVGNNWIRVAPNFYRGFDNIDTFLAVGKQYKTLGLINTLWSADSGQGLLRQCRPGVAYGSIASWQSPPVDRSRFFLEYARQMYGSAVAPGVAQALEDLARSEAILEKVFGAEDTTPAMWDNPFASYRLKAAREHRESLGQARLLAEDAEERLDRALALGSDRFTLDSLLLGSRMLDYTGMKYLYALQMSEAWEHSQNQKEGSSPQTGWRPWPIVGMMLGRGVHSWMGDLMDTITRLRRDYLDNWQAEYSPFREGRVQQFDLEYEYWNQVQSRYLAFEKELKPGEPLPSLETIVKFR